MTTPEDNSTTTIEQIDAEFNADNSSDNDSTEFDVKIEASSTPANGSGRNKRSPEEKARAEAAREAKRQAAAAKRAQKEAALANRPARHSVKLHRAAQSLPTLTSDAQGLFEDLITNLDSNELLAVSAHVNHHVRAQKTELSRDLPKLDLGTEVLITGTNADNISFLNQRGTILKSQSIHVIVDVNGSEVYLFRSDVMVEDANSQDLVSNG